MITRRMSRMECDPKDRATHAFRSLHILGSSSHCADMRSVWEESHLQCRIT